jgi:hypothetical protein
VSDDTGPPALGTVDLFLPDDWFDLLLDTEADAGERFTELARATWPHHEPSLWSAVAEVLLQWRARMLARGAISHGVVSAHLDDGTPARWQVVTSVVDLPAEPELDVAAMVVRLVEARQEEVLHLEQYETDLGLGVGLIAQPELLPPDETEVLGLPVVHEAVRVGVAASLACAPGAGHGLLVVGMCLAPEQVVELAGLVAVIAGRSVLRRASPEPGAGVPAG